MAVPPTRGKRAPCLVLIAALLAASHARPAAACTCAYPVGIEEAIASSEAIFLGRAMRIEWALGDEPRPPLGGYSASVAITFEVDTQWKGGPSGSITVYTGSGGGDCGTDFDVGRDYIVYATLDEGHGGSILVTSICHRGFAASREEPRTRYEMEELDRLVLGRGAPDPETERARTEIRRLYESFATTVRSIRNAESWRTLHDGAPAHPRSGIPPRRAPEEVLPFLCDSVFDRYAVLRELALHAGKQELLAGSLFTAMEVLALRHRIDGPTLTAMTPRDLVVRFYQAGWEPKLGFFGLELGRFAALGDDVLVDAVGDARLFRGGRTILEKRFRFERVHGGWCFDATWSPPPNDGGQTLRYAADAMGRPLDEYVLELAAGLLRDPADGAPSDTSPVELSPSSWEPLAGAR